MEDIILTEEKKYCVYMHINNINQKKYIGITCQNPNNRWKKNGSGYKDCPRFWNAINKYGWDNFSHIILQENLSKKEANIREQEYINLYNTINENYGYNLTTGGDNNYTFPNEIKTKMSKAQQGSNNSMYQHNYTAEEKKRMSENQKGSKSKCAKQVKCIETGEIFECLGDTHIFLGVDYETAKKMVSKVCLGDRKNYLGYHFEYINEEDKINKKRPHKRKIICLNDNKVFDSIAEASRYYSIPASCISKSCKNKRDTYNMTFRYYNEYVGE